MKSHHGFTLLELLIVMLLIVVMFYTVEPFITRGVQGLALGESAAAKDWEARVALERIVREIRELREDAVLSGTSSSFFSYNTFTAETVTFTYNSGTQQILRSNGVTSEVLAKNVTAFAFSYYDVNGNPTTNFNVYAPPFAFYFVISATFDVGGISTTPYTTATYVRVLS